MSEPVFCFVILAISLHLLKIVFSILVIVANDVDEEAQLLEHKDKLSCLPHAEAIQDFEI